MHAQADSQDDRIGHFQGGSILRATPEGTLRYVQAQPEVRRANYRETSTGLWVSSIGLGTYLGEADEVTDLAYQAACGLAYNLGCNLIDCAINYRFQHSERAIGRWLAEALATEKLRRDEIVICTKGGFVPFKDAMPPDPKRWVYDTFIAPGMAHAVEFAANYQHCLAPGYLEQMIAWSLRNLGMETLDIYYLHNPETQRIVLSRDTFRARMLDAFETLELAVENGQIGSYGTSTWTAYRTLTDAPEYVSLTEMVGLAIQVAGDGHHFRYSQLPYNLLMTEAFALENQQLGEQFMSAIEAAGELGLTVMISAPLMQGRLAYPIMPQLAEILTGLSSDAQRAIQFVRSSPGVTSALVGMKDSEHVQENLALMDIAPADGEIIRGMYKQR
jgi:aryl-alcohol dehydrogenase-like predicted oxidoreductase